MNKNEGFIPFEPSDVAIPWWLSAIVAFGTVLLSLGAVLGFSQSGDAGR
jgi:hypothetical protein